MKVHRKCNECKKEYLANEADLKRGWGLYCSASCAAKQREKKKPNYNPERVAKNNLRRANWNTNKVIAPSVGGSGVVTGFTSEGYRIMDGVAYNEFDEAMYNIS